MSVHTPGPWEYMIGTHGIFGQGDDGSQRADEKAALMAPLHTSGPWSAHTSYAGYEVWTGPPEQVMHGYRICAVDLRGQMSANVREMRANAMLIAAAPMLIAALQRLLDRSASEHWPVEQQMARDAITAAKTEGGA